jgi:anti-sigma-K factor RskA
MSRPPVPRDEWQELAGEYALGLLEGDELARAGALFADDSEFRAEVGRWRGWLAPLLDEIGPVSPRDEVWRAIEARLSADAPAGGNVYQLRRRVDVWRGVAAAATALAASLAVVLVTRPDQVAPPVQTPAPAPAPAPAPLVAMLGGEDPAARLLATWNPAERRLVIAASDALTIGEDRARELWVIPADGTPRSLGVLRGTAREQLAPGADVSAHLQRGATLAISVEPAGGSPTGLPTGPVVVSGPLEPV